MTGRSIILTAGALRFAGRLELQSAPVSAAWIVERLPLTGEIIQARWSGEAGWVRLGPMPLLPVENATCYPQVGQVLLYSGPLSEPELLVPFGACAFASKAGALAGNHVITLEPDAEQLRKLGENLIRHGAQSFALDWS